MIALDVSVMLRKSPIQKHQLVVPYNCTDKARQLCYIFVIQLCQTDTKFFGDYALPVRQ
jgi:hypothetical protein